MADWNSLSDRVDTAVSHAYGGACGLDCTEVPQDEQSDSVPTILIEPAESTQMVGTLRSAYPTIH
jgi:hypothetical protein